VLEQNGDQADEEAACHVDKQGPEPEIMVLREEAIDAVTQDCADVSENGTRSVSSSPHPCTGVAEYRRPAEGLEF